MRPDSVLRRYGVAILANAAAFLISLSMWPMLTHSHFALFLLAVAVSAWNGGLGPGVLSAVIGTIAINYFLVRPSFFFTLATPAFWPLLAEFFLIACGLTIILTLLRSTQEHAARNLALLDVLLTEAPVGLAFLDCNLQPVRVNPAFAALYPPRQPRQAEHETSTVTSPFASATESLLRRVLDTGESVINQEACIAVAGQPRDVLVSYYPIRKPSGRLLGVGAVVMDITQRKRAEEAHEQLATQLRLLLESTGEGIYGIDLHGQCTFINRAGAEMLGYRPDELLDRKMHDTIHYRHPGGAPYPESDCPIYRAFQAGQAIRIEDEVFWRRNGQPFPVEYSSFPIVVGEIIRGAVVTFNDITIRKQAEATRVKLVREEAARSATASALGRLESILESANNALIYIDAETNQVTANPEATRLFGQPIAREAGPGLFSEQIRYPDGPPVPEAQLPSFQALRGQSPPRLEVLIARPDGTLIPAVENAAPVWTPEGTVTGAVVVFQDISAIKHMEQMREEWTSVIAHDLRQPVAVIAGYADLLMRSGAQFPPALQTRIEHIRTSARQLNRMVGDLLDVSRIESRRLTLERVPLDLPTLVTQVTERMETVLKGHRVTVETVGKIPKVNADSGRIEQVLTNLLSNAAKYSHPRTDIQVRVERLDGDVQVAVTNWGPGIRAEEIPRLFTRFHRTEAAQTGNVPGLGLGLYIAKGIVEAHRGQIRVESTPGKTTTFCFSLPIGD